MAEAHEQEPWEQDPLAEHYSQDDGLGDNAHDQVSTTAEVRDRVDRKDSWVVADGIILASSPGSALAHSMPSECLPTHTEEPYEFSKHDLKEQVTSTHTGNSIPIRTVLILFAGLPVESKEKIVHELMRMCISHQERPDQYAYEVAAIEPTDTLKFDWFERSPWSLFRLALACGIYYKNVLKGNAFTFNFRPDEHQPFVNQHLKNTFSKIADDLSSNRLFEKGSVMESDPARYWKKVIPNGLHLMNMWNIPFKRAALHSLSAIIGRLHNSHCYLFIDLQEDVPRLLSPPNVLKEKNPTGDVQHLMKHRSRLEYLVRSATVAKSTCEHKTDACTIVAVHNGTLDEEKLKGLCTKLQEAVGKEAKKMKLGKLIDPELLVLNYNSPYCSKPLKEHIDKFLLKLQSKNKFLPSWLFLLDTLKCLGDMFIEKTKLEEMAKECKVVGDDLEEMLTTFTAFGSVIYIPYPDSLKKIIILQPQEFVQQLSKLYSPEESKDTSLHNRYGILTEEAAQEIFGDTASTYLEILRSAGVSMLLSTSKVQNVCDFQTAAQSVDYIPSVRVMQEQATCDTCSLHLRVSNDFAPVNTHVALADSIRKSLEKEDFQVCLVPVMESNVTKFEIKSDEVALTITLVYQRSMYEIQLDVSRGAHESLTSIRLGICRACFSATWERKNCFADIKMSFVVICPTCHDSFCSCDVSHIQCYLPVSSQCKKCKRPLAPTSPFFEWKDAVDKTHIPTSRSHIKDSVDPEDLLKVAAELSLPKVSDDERKRLALALGLNLTDEEFQQQKQKLGLRGMLLLAFLLWEKERVLGPPADSELADILRTLGYHDLAESIEEDYIDVL